MRIRRLAGLVGVLALLAGGAVAQPAGPADGGPADGGRAGGVADCARGGDLLVRMICASPALAAAARDNARVYSALRQQAGRLAERRLMEEAGEKQAALFQACGVDAHEKPPAAGGAGFSKLESCLADGLRAQREAWFGLLGAAGREEVARADPAQAQRDLHRLGLLDSRVAADGIYRPSTRAAIRAWQQQSGRTPTGLLSDTDAAALAEAAAAPPPAPAPAAPASPAGTADPETVGVDKGAAAGPAVPAQPVGAPPAGALAPVNADMRFATARAEVLAIGPGVRPVIFAQGMVTEATPQALDTVLGRGVAPGTVLVLSSGGGDGVAGLRMGRMIRRAGLLTVIGQPGPDGSVQSRGVGCYSACADMFLGGVERFHAPGSLFGVHRFRLLNPVPTQSFGAVASAIFAQERQYAVEMGVDPAIVDEAMRAGPQGINILSPERMAALRVTTTGGTVSWAGSAGAQPGVVRTHSADTDGRHSAAFGCPRRGDPNPLLYVQFRPADPEVAPIAVRWPLQLRADGAPVALLGEEIATPVRASGGSLVLVLRLTPRLVALFGQARVVSVGSMAPDGVSSLGVDMDTGPDRNRLTAFLAACR